MTLPDTEWDDPEPAAAGTAVDQALLVAAARRRLQARLDQAADRQIAAILDGAEVEPDPAVPGMAKAADQALRELQADQLEQQAAAARA